MSKLLGCFKLRFLVLLRTLYGIRSQCNCSRLNWVRVFQCYQLDSTIDSTQSLDNPRVAKTILMFQLLFVLLCILSGDIELNPGGRVCCAPSLIKMMELNVLHVCDNLSVDEHQRLSLCDDEWYCRSCCMPSFSEHCCCVN